MASSKPSSIAIVRSNTTVRRNVTIITVTSDLGVFRIAFTVRHPLMLYETMMSTPARHAIGTRLMSGIRNRKMSSSTTACTTPATGVRPPLVMLVIVRAMAPVTGMPPKNGTTTFATPWPISSVLQSVFDPVAPSATVADSSDSMAPSIAMVNADGRRALMVAMLMSMECGDGIVPDRLWKRSPIVSTPSSPQYSCMAHTAAVTTIMASSAPGRRFDT